jgi:hypothetical protein
MNNQDFIDLLGQFSKRPIPATINRHMYLWVGNVDHLLSQSPPGLIKALDLHMLCQGLNKTPYGEKAAGRELSDAMEGWISQEFSSSPNQKALLVTGLDLLYRYRLPFGSLIRLANENCMIILGLPALDINFHPARPLPGYIQLAPDALLRYITTEIAEDAIILEGE